MPPVEGVPLITMPHSARVDTRAKAPDVHSQGRCGNYAHSTVRGGTARAFTKGCPYRPVADGRADRQVVTNRHRITGGAGPRAGAVRRTCMRNRAATPFPVPLKQGLNLSLVRILALVGVTIIGGGRVLRTRRRIIRVGPLG